jgi:hypothetical protein
MSRNRIRAAAAPLALVLGLGGCGIPAALSTASMLSGLFTGPAAADGVATVNAEIRSNDAEQQLLHVVTEEGLRGVVRWDVQTQVVRGIETQGAVALQTGDQVQMRLRKLSDVDIYTDYVLVRQRAQPAAAEAAVDTAVVTLTGTVSALDAERGQFQLRTASGRDVLVALPFNPPAAVTERFNRLSDGDEIRVAGRYIAENRLELERFN